MNSHQWKIVSSAIFIIIIINIYFIYDSQMVTQEDKQWQCSETRKQWLITILTDVIAAGKDWFIQPLPLHVVQYIYFKDGRQAGKGLETIILWEASASLPWNNPTLHACMYLYVCVCVPALQNTNGRHSLHGLIMRFVMSTRSGNIRQIALRILNSVWCLSLNVCYHACMLDQYIDPAYMMKYNR